MRPRGEPRLLLLLLLLAASCGAPEEMPPTTTGMEIRSSAFSEGEPVPAEFTCDGEGVSPPLEWSGTPDDASTLQLLVDDPDAPGGTFVHWVVRDIPPGVEGADRGEAPAGGIEGENSTGESSYLGPCPPRDDSPHRYRFTIQAFDTAGKVLAGGTLTARYGRER